MSRYDSLAEHNAAVIASRDMDPPDMEFPEAALPDPAQPAIATFADLCDYFGADYTLRSLNRRAYKDTACGACISIMGQDGTWYHNGEDEPPAEFVLEAFSINTIVEGSDVEFSTEIRVPCSPAEVAIVIEEIEAEADYAWHAANEVPFTAEEDFEAGYF